MIGRPAPNEAAPYYFGYINRVKGDDIVSILETQLEETLPFLRSISEEQSLHRYAADKWSIRESWSHVNDVERVFSMRAFWFARSFDSPMPSFDQNIAAKNAGADRFPWAAHIEEFRMVRLSTLALFRKLSPEDWNKSGIASENRFTVRAVAYILAGHVVHHREIIEQRYLAAISSEVASN